MLPRGHKGMSLLIYSPVSLLLIWIGYPLLAIIGGYLVWNWSMLPDIDIKTKYLTHRGITHTFTFGIIWGVILVLSVLGPLYLLDFTLATQLNLTQSGAIITAVFNIYTLTELSVFFFSIGFLSVIGHICGDVITPSGIRPFQPFSNKKLKFKIRRYDNKAMNYVFSKLGRLSFIVSLLGGITLWYSYPHPLVILSAI